MLVQYLTCHTLLSALKSEMMQNLAKPLNSITERFQLTAISSTIA